MGVKEGGEMEKEFADVLRDLREKAGLTQEALARKADLSLGYIAKLEQGKAQPSWATVKALAKALGTTCAAFERNDPFTGESEPAKRSRKGGQA
jgi:transcriptional regulator with XRE-family HTH domain